MGIKNSIKSIAIGSFDGIHLAHQQLIGEAEAVVVIEKNRAYITHGYRRRDYLDKPIFFYHFEKIKGLSPKEFIKKIEEDFPKLKKIVVGYDFRFGYKKRGDTKVLKELFNGEVLVIDEVKYRGISIHSCIIKEIIKRGKIKLTNRLLNHPYKIVGSLIKGQGLGAKELVPTLNLDVKYYILPKSGVYITKTFIKNRWLNSLTFLGDRKTTDGKFSIETHILNMDIGKLKDKTDIEVEFYSLLRENRKFKNLKELKSQIEYDIEEAIEYFKLKTY